MGDKTYEELQKMYRHWLSLQTIASAKLEQIEAEMDRLRLADPNCPTVLLDCGCEVTKGYRCPVHSCP